MNANVNVLELVTGFSPRDTFAMSERGPVDLRRFLGEVGDLAQRLPDAPAVLNLCHDRYRFLVGFAAALVRGQISVLPPSEAPRVVEEIAGRYRGGYCLTDQAGTGGGLETFVYPRTLKATDGNDAVPGIPAEQTAAVVFTSGSTGGAVAHEKTWGSLVTGAAMARARFFTPGPPRSVVGTVPAQHMYGLETTVVLPMQSGTAIHHARPLMPRALAAALEETRPPRMLVTTPVHLKACVREGAMLPELELIISATAPLTSKLARQAESLLGAWVREIYGCTEAGSIASRRTTDGELWQAYEGMRVFQQGDRSFVTGDPLRHPVELADIIRLGPGDRFSLHGRTADQVNVAGKRESLANLNNRLNEIPGVADGVYFMPEENPDKVTRLAAAVVAPGLTRAQILEALRRSIDSAFMPRPLVMVDSLPRSGTGKLPRRALLDLLHRQSSPGRRARNV